MFLSNVMWSIVNALIGGVFFNFAGSPITITNNLITAFLVNVLGL